MTAESTAELVDALRSCDARCEPVLVVGGGSNLLVTDAGFEGTAVLVRSRGIATEVRGGSVALDVAAGEPWDALVEHTVSTGLSGIEALSGIPGLVGATPIQNVGAYGALLWQVLFPTFAWRPRWRLLLVGGAVVGFVVNAWLFQMPMFGAAVLIGCLGYVTEWRWLGGLFARRFTRSAAAEQGVVVKSVPVAAGQS